MLRSEKSISVFFFYKSQAGFNQFDLGSYDGNPPIRLGLWLKGIPVFKETAGLNAVILLLEYSFQNFIFNYSYDISTSRLLISTGGVHEVSLSYQFEINKGYKKRKKMAAIPCPKF